MLRRILLGLVLLVVLAVAGLYALGSGWLGRHWGPGTPTPTPIPDAVIEQRASTQASAAQGAEVAEPKQILFGDLHVHTSYSTDAFLLAIAQRGEGAKPVSDACDFARYCSALDFWSINDHAFSLTPRRWTETVEAIRQCNAVAGDPESPDVTAFLGWEWTQIGDTPADHYGHKNVVLRDQDDGAVPTRPIAARMGEVWFGTKLTGTLVMGLVPVTQRTRNSLDLVR